MAKNEGGRPDDEDKEDVDWTGASQLSSRSMTGRQKRVLDQIMLRIYELGEAESEHLRRAKFDREVYRRAQEIRRPRHVFFIDGARGSGKTSMLLTLAHYLKALGNAKKWGEESGRYARVISHLKANRNDLARKLDRTHKDLEAANDDRADEWKAINTDKLFENPHLNYDNERKRRTACLLPMLQPSDLENSQSIMEGIFSVMDSKLDNHVKKQQRQKGRDGEPDKRADELRKRLYEQVAKGWHLAASKRDESIRAYSYNLDNYLSVLGRTGAESYARVHNWSLYVNDYLDYFGDQLLVIFLDDTDVTPQVTADILHTIRVFLDHPRIVTVLAGNLRAMRQSLIWHLLQTLKDPIEMLAGPTSGTAVSWRRQVRHQIEEYLEKILPRSTRFFLSVHTKVELSDADGEQAGTKSKTTTTAGKRANDDFSKVAGQAFDDYCREKLSDLRDKFLQVKVEAFKNQRLRRRELESAEERRHLENFLAWWLYRHWYGDSLRPRSIRQLRTLVGLTSATPDAPEASRRLPHERPKRLAVILFEAPENHELIDRFSDADTHVGKWLRRQPVTSSWRGERYFDVGERKLHRGTYGYDFLCYRLDLGIMMPLLENPDDQLPVGVLPRMSGQNMTGMTPFLPQMRPQPAFGVSRRILHSVLPSNCIYFYDLQSLPNIAFEPGSRPFETAHEKKDIVANEWDTNLIYNWPDLFDLESNIKSKSAEPRSRPATDPSVANDPELNTKIANYIKEIVLPLGSLELGRFTRSKRANTKAESRPLVVIENTDGFTKERRRIDSLRRHYDYYDHFANTKLGGAAATSLAEGTVIQWNDWVRSALELEADSVASPQVMIAESFEPYQALINDIRRAWHAGRILVNQMPPSKDEKSKQFEASRRNHFSDGDRYTIPSLDAIGNQWINHSHFSEAAFSRLSQELPASVFAGEQIKTVDDLFDQIAKDPTALESGGEPIWEKVTASGMLGVASARLRGAAEAKIKLGAGDVKIVLPTERRPHTSDSKEKPIQIDSSCKDDVQVARYAKFVCLYFWALSPCLPALMHLEYAATIYHDRHKDDKETGKAPDKEADIETDKKNLAAGLGRAINRMSFWRDFLRQVTTYYIRYRISVELSLVRLQLIEAWPKDKRVSVDHGVGFTMIPDISFGSMGTQGVNGLIEKLGKEPQSAKEPWAIELKKRLKPQEGSAPARDEPKSVFRDLEEKLLYSWKYLRQLESLKVEGSQVVVPKPSAP